MRHPATRILLLTLLAVLIFAPAPARAVPDSFFDVWLEIPFAGPPYPTQPVITIVGSNLGSFTTYAQVSMALKSYDHGDPLDPMPGHVQGRDSGGGPGLYGIDSFFDVFMDVPMSTPMPPANFRISLRDDVMATGLPSRLVARHPELPPDDPNRYCDISRYSSFFDIFCTCDNGLGLIDYHFHGFKGLCDCSFLNVGVTLNPVDHAQSFFDIFTEVSCQGMENPALPCWSIQTTATFTPFVVPTVRMTWSGVKTLLGP